MADYAERHTVGRGLWKWTHYYEAYERHLAKFVGEEVTVVEIGVYSGGSLDMWREYFGPRCRLIGVDIAEECRAYQDDQISIEIGDQGDPEFWRAFLGRHPTIDVVIDDGGHHADQQVPTLEALLPRLSPGGVYACEDVTGVHNPFEDYMAGLARNLNRWDAPDPRDSRTIPGPFQTMVASIHRYPYLVLIERSADPPREFSCPRRGTEWVPF
ncbi:MAG TPA: class I SAM-dependent methyltransferase [Solirubrobacteraceae bacterium]